MRCIHGNPIPFFFFSGGVGYLASSCMQWAVCLTMQNSLVVPTADRAARCVSPRRVIDFGAGYCCKYHQVACKPFDCAALLALQGSGFKASKVMQLLRPTSSLDQPSKAECWYVLVVLVPTAAGRKTVPLVGLLRTLSSTSTSTSGPLRRSSGASSNY